MVSVLFGVGLLFTFFFVFLFCWYTRNPLASLPRASAVPVLVKVQAERRDHRIFQRVSLFDKILGDINFALSLPDPLPNQRLPVVFVIGGLGAGEHSLRFVQDMGNNAIVGYDWPLPTRFSRNIGVRHILTLRTRVLSVPGQVSAILIWLIAQPWSDPTRISVLGFSLGAMVTPAADRIAATQGLRVGWTVLAYGGAPIGAVIRGNQRLHPAWLRLLLAFSAGCVLRPIDPAEHLPHLDGHFLVLTGAEDTIVSEKASARLVELTPVPKQVIRQLGNHIGTGPDHQAVTESAIEITRRWLIAEGAINQTTSNNQTNSMFPTSSPDFPK
jgi:hypothetical protein